MLRLSQQGFRKLQLRLFCMVILFSGPVIFLDDSTADQVGGDEYQPAETDSEFTFRVPVDVVVVNAVVSDESGRPVTDLTADDFEVYEDGEPQSIQTFTRESYQRVSVAEDVERGEEPEPRSVGVEDSGVGQVRYLSLFIDDLTSPSLGSYIQIRDAMRRFLKQSSQASDQVAIVSASGRFQVPFTQDRARLLQEISQLPKKLNISASFRSDCPEMSDLQAERIFNSTGARALEVAVSEVIRCQPWLMASETTPQETDPAIFAAGGFVGGVVTGAATSQRLAEGWVRRLAAQQHRESEYRNRRLMLSLRHHVRSLKHFKGRKSLILCSDGFLSQERRYEMHEIIDSALRAGVILNTLDIRGLYTTGYTATQGDQMALGGDLMIAKTQMRTEDMQLQAEALAELAGETGGIYFHGSNDLFAGLQKISDNQSLYYVLTYASPSQASDGRYHRIKVNVRRPGLKISHRKGYFSQKERISSERLKKKDIVGALQALGSLNEIPVQVSYNTSRLANNHYQLDVLTQLDFRGFPFLEENHRRTNLMHLVVVVFDAKGKYVGGQEKAVDFKLTDPSYLALLRHGLKSRVGVQVGAGRYTIKVVVRESIDTLLGSFRKTIEVPQTTQGLADSQSIFSVEERTLMEAFDSPTTLRQLPLTLRASYFYDKPELARILIAAEINGKPTPSEPGDSRKISVLGLAYAADGIVASGFRETLMGSSSGFAYRNYFKLSPGKYRLKLAASDESGRSGTAEQDLFIPALPSGRTVCSSLVVSQELGYLPPYLRNLQEELAVENDPLFHQGFQIFEPTRNRFHQDHPVAVFYRLYNLTDHREGRDWTARVRLSNANGEGHEFSPLPLAGGLEPGAAGEVTVGFKLPIHHLPPGAYELSVETDLVPTGRSVGCESERVWIGSQPASVSDPLDGIGLLKYYDVPAPVDVAETSYQDEAYLKITQLKDPSQQAPLIEAFLRDYPQSKHLAGLHRLATLVFLQLRDHRKLVEHGETALRLSPAQPEILRVLAKAYQAAGELDKAIDRASGALSAIKEISKPAGLDESRWRSQLHLFFSDNYACLGSVFFEKYETERRKSSASQGETALHLEKAADYLRKAVALDPRSAFAQFHLGIVFAAQNLLDEAMGSLAKAVVLEEAFADIAQENLEAIYKAIHRDSLYGLNEVIEKARTDLGATKGDISMR